MTLILFDGLPVSLARTSATEATVSSVLESVNPVSALKLLTTEWILSSLGLWFVVSQTTVAAVSAFTVAT